MEYCINIGYLTRTVSMPEAAKILSEHGFTALDYTPPVEKDNWKSVMRENLDIFESFGLRVNQTHAPYNRYGKWGNIHKLCVDRAVEASAEMGAEFMVVHGDEFDFENTEYSKEKALEYNHNYFLPFVEKAEKSGVSVAFENLFQEANHDDAPRFCSSVDELSALINSFDNGGVSCCWDFGHANVSFKEGQPQNMAVVADYIKCTHVHDNDCRSDEHLPPFFGRIDWKTCIDVLKKADYKGILSYELVHGNIPPYVMPDFVSMLKKSGEELWK